LIRRPPQGASDPADCFAEFNSDGGVANLLPYDVIPMEASALQLQAAATTPTACQAGCANSTFCQASAGRRGSARG
jgi:hypothetical protein